MFVRAATAAICFFALTSDAFADSWNTSHDVEITQLRQGFDRVNRRIFSYASINNTSGTAIGGDLRLVIEHPSSPVLNADGTTFDGHPFIRIHKPLAAYGTMKVKVEFPLTRTRIQYVSSLESNTNIETGIFLDSPVSGVEYVTATQSGVTTDTGAYRFLPGETVSFFIGDILLGEARATGVLTPLDLASESELLEDVNGRAFMTIALLQTLDFDKNPANGITVTQEMREAARGLNGWPVTRNLDDVADIAKLILNVEVQLPPNSDIISHFNSYAADNGKAELCLIHNDYAEELYNNAAFSCETRAKRYLLINNVFESMDALIAYRETLANDAMLTNDHFQDTVGDLYNIFLVSEIVKDGMILQYGSKKDRKKILKDAAYKYARAGFVYLAPKIAEQEYGETAKGIAAIWSRAFDAALDAPGCAAGSMLDCIAFVKANAQTALELFSDVITIYRVDNNHERINELVIGKEVLRRFYSNYEDWKLVATDLGVAIPLTGPGSLDTSPVTGVEFTDRSTIVDIIYAIAFQSDCYGSRLCGVSDFSADNVFSIVDGYIEFIESAKQQGGLSAPWNVKAELDKEAGQITVSWNKVPSATVYRLYHYTTEYKDTATTRTVEVIHNISSTSYTHSYAEPTNKHEYALIAVGEEGRTSDFSDHAIVEPSQPVVSETVHYNPGNGNYYRLSLAPATWQEARQHARSTEYEGKQGKLVTIESQEENNFVSLLSEEHIWIGATDDNSDGAWYWDANGIRFWESESSSQQGKVIGKNFVNWVPGEEPTHGDSTISGTSYAFMAGAGVFRGYWGFSDGFEVSGRPYVIEYDTGPSAHYEALLAPNGGEFWIQGETNTITWNNTAITGSHISISILFDDPSDLLDADNLDWWDVRYGQDGLQRDWHRFAVNIDNDGSFDLDPQILGANGDGLLILIESDEGKWDISNGTFSLSDGSPAYVVAYDQELSEELSEYSVEIRNVAGDIVDSQANANAQSKFELYPGIYYVTVAKEGFLSVEFVCQVIERDETVCRIGLESLPDSIVFHPESGLYWNTNVSRGVKYPDAEAECSSMNTGGMNWRLPSQGELAEIVELSQLGPKIDSELSSVGSQKLWSTSNGRTSCGATALTVTCTFRKKVLDTSNGVISDETYLTTFSGFGMNRSTHFPQASVCVSSP